MKNLKTIKELMIAVLIFTSTVLYSQNSKSTQFEFPNSRMGEFAKIWFKSINENTLEGIRTYNQDGYWDDNFSRLSELSKNVNGFIPYQISYETEDLISIYSKEKSQSWIKVKLGLNSKNEISLVSIRKSVKAVDYKLKNNLNKAAITDIVLGIVQELRTNYVIKKSRIPYANALKGLLNSGKYDSITQGDLLADILTQDLIKLSNDKHLQIIPPSKINEVNKRFGFVDSEVNNTIEDIKNIKRNGVHQVTTKLSLNEKNDELTLEQHGGLAQLEETETYTSSKNLKDNVGYINITRFVGNKNNLSNIENIFYELKNAKAIIIDLRYSGGGDDVATNYLLSFFLKSRKPINSTQKELRMLYNSKPLFVLTSKKTISAGEAFVYQLKKNKRATIIGEITAGAGYRVNVFKIPNDFYFVNSIYTTFDAEKGEGWQGTGVKPDIQTSSYDALKKAINLIN